MKASNKFWRVAALLILLVGMASMVAASEWENTASLPEERSGLGTAVLDGSLYAVGGRDNDNNVRNTVFRYDPSSDSWSSVASLPEEKSNLGTGVLDGELYAVGGSDGDRTNTVFRYDSSSDSWSTVASLPEVRFNPGTAVLDGSLYVVGGQDDSFSQKDTVFRYDPSSDSWSSVASLPQGRSNLGTSVLDGELYAVGGVDTDFDARDTVFRYDSGSDSWSTVASLPEERSGLGTAVLDGSLYAVAGSDDNNVRDTVFRYDPSSDSWSSVASLPQGRSNLGTEVLDGELYAVGGRDDNFDRKDTVFRLGFNEPPEFDSVSSSPSPPQIGNTVSYFADLTDPDDDSELIEVELQLEYGGQQVYQESRVVSGDSDSASWSDVFVPEETNEWLNATFTATDTAGDSTTEELNYFLEDTPPEVTINSPGNQTYWSYDVPYEIEVDADNDSVPDQVFDLELYSDGQLVDSFQGTGSETFSGEFRQDLGENIVFEASASDSGGSTSESVNFSVNLFEFISQSSDSTTFESLEESFSSNQEIGEMVEEVQYSLIYGGETVSVFTEEYSGHDSLFEETSHDIGLVESDGVEKDWSFEAEVFYETVDGGNTSDTVHSGEHSQTVNQAFTFESEFLSDGSPQLEASDLNYNANISQETSEARGSLSGEAEFSQTGESLNLDQENAENQSRMFSNVFESELVDSGSESHSFDLSIEYVFQGESRTIESSSLTVDLDRIELTEGSGEEALRFETFDEQDLDSSLRSDLEVNFEVYNPDSPELFREYDFDFEDSDSHSVYLDPGYGEVEVDVFGDNYIEFDKAKATGDSDLYDRRRHYLMDEPLSSDTSVVELYLLEKDSASRVEVLVEDEELNSVPDQVVRVERSFSGGSEQRTVVMGQSGSTGTDSVFIDDDEQYVFTVFNEEGERIERIGSQSIPTDLEVQLQVDADPIRRFDDLIRGVEFQTTVLEDEVIVEYDTEREELNSIELKVLEDSMFDDIEVGSSESSATSGELTVSGFNASDGQFQYRLNGYFDDEEFLTSSDKGLLMDSGRFGEGVSQFQEGGLFISLLLFMTLTFSGLYRPEASIALGALSLVVASFVGFLPIGQTSLIAVVSVAAVMIWRMI